MLQWFPKCWHDFCFIFKQPITIFWQVIQTWILKIDHIHFTVVFLVSWPLSESEAAVDLVMIQKVLYQSKVSSSLTLTQRPGHQAHNCKMGYWLELPSFESKCKGFHFHGNFRIALFNLDFNSIIFYAFVIDQSETLYFVECIKRTSKWLSIYNFYILSNFTINSNTNPYIFADKKSCCEPGFPVLMPAFWKSCPTMHWCPITNSRFLMHFWVPI